MPHLAYLGQTEKGGEFAVEIFPKGWVQTPISACHTLYTTGRYGLFVKLMWGDGICRFVPQVWGVAPLGYINSPSISH